MTKSLADMTTEEREACVGMWASHQGHEDRNEPCGNLGVISEINGDYAWIAFPKESAETYVFDFADLTPRHDLPRAWTPDGEPEIAQTLAEEYQYGVTYTGVKHGGHHIEWVENTGDAELDEDRLQIVVKGWKQMGQSPKIVRRRVSPPEVIND